MLDKIKNSLIWVLGIIGALYFYERSKRKLLELDILKKDMDLEDRDLVNKQNNADENINRLESEMNNLPKPKQEDLTPEEIEKYWNSKDNENK